MKKKMARMKISKLKTEVVRATLMFSQGDAIQIRPRLGMYCVGKNGKQLEHLIQL
jgi:hypothetical protein